MLAARERGTDVNSLKQVYQCGGFYVCSASSTTCLATARLNSVQLAVVSRCLKRGSAHVWLQIASATSEDNQGTGLQLLPDMDDSETPTADKNVETLIDSIASRNYIFIACFYNKQLLCFIVPPNFCTLNVPNVPKG